MNAPTCPYCSAQAQLVGGDVIHAHRPDEYKKKFWLCVPCDAYVGTQPGTTIPLGRLANAELRYAKSAAHAAFDPLWRAKMVHGKVSKGRAKGMAYIWLAQKLGLPTSQVNIGMFDVDQCMRVVELCRRKAA